MTKYRKNDGGGGSLKAHCANCRKAVARYENRKSTVPPMPMGSGRHSDHRERHAARAALAGDAVGTDSRAFPAGGRCELRAGQRGRRSPAHTDCRGNAFPQSWCAIRILSHDRRWIRYRTGRCKRRCKLLEHRQVRFNRQQWSVSPPQQHAPVSCGLYLAPNRLTPERGGAV